MNKLISGGILLSLGILFSAFGLERTLGSHLIIAFLLSFGGYALLLCSPAILQSKHLRLLIGLGIGLRVILVFAFPSLSDDIYRFIWDGQLINSGINPFAQLPAYYLETGHEVAGLSQELYNRLNSPEYYTIYPPVAQGVFTLATWLSPNSWYGASVIMKLFLLAAELGTLWLLIRLLFHFALPQVRLLYYWLNPLIIIEIMGNLHFEGAMVAFLLLGLWGLVRSRWIMAAVGVALSVASKLLPLMLMPFLVKRLWARPFWIFSTALGISLALLFFPLLTAGFPDNFGSSLDLYFRKFEFNASLYYLARAYGYWEIGWNQIARFGPLLAKIAMASILLFAFLERGFKRSNWSNAKAWRQLAASWMWAFVIYLICATTVHPWYLCVPLVLSIFSQWRFLLLWSALIMLTYATYLTNPYQEMLWLVALEYLVVAAFAVWEWRFRKVAS